MAIRTIDILDVTDAIDMLIMLESQIRAARNLWHQCQETTLTADINARYLILGELEDKGRGMKYLKDQLVERLERNSYPFTLVSKD